MQRTLLPAMQKDLARKIILLSGPRQCGKTTLAKMVRPQYDYFNYDYEDDRLALLTKSWDRSKPLVIFDELHKMKNWKAWLKGIYDAEGIPPSYLVTGSAKLDTYRKAGDSLAGRFFHFRLHPLDLKEIAVTLRPKSLDQALQKLLLVGGFPEPYLTPATNSKNPSDYYNRWKKSHLDVIIRQDLLALENVKDLTSIETLIALMRRRVGSPISYHGLAGELQCSDKTVKHWLDLLERMYILFKVTPYHRNIARSLLKSPKYYFYDTGQVVGDTGVKLENLVAGALLKELQYREDCLGEEKQLFYLRDKGGHEIDFCITDGDRPIMFLEVKTSDDTPAPGFAHFAKHQPDIRKIQLVYQLKRDKSYRTAPAKHPVEIRAAAAWLSTVPL